MMTAPPLMLTPNTEVQYLPNFFERGWIFWVLTRDMFQWIVYIELFSCLSRSSYRIWESQRLENSRKPCKLNDIRARKQNFKNWHIALKHCLGWNSVDLAKFFLFSSMTELDNLANPIQSDRNRYWKVSTENKQSDFMKKRISKMLSSIITQRCVTLLSCRISCYHHCILGLTTLIAVSRTTLYDIS